MGSHHPAASMLSVQLVPTILLLLLPPSVQPPSLVQHRDGRFFAVNANLQHGQLFRTADGRLFTLAQSSQAVQAAREVSADIKTTVEAVSSDLPSGPNPRVVPAESEATQAVRVV